MKKLLKVLSILELIIGILGLIVSILALTAGGLISGVAELPVEQEVAIVMIVSAVMGLISGAFNCGCGICGLKGANGNVGKISAAVVLGWIGLISAVISGVLTLFGDVSAGRITSAICGIIVPVLFLISAKSVKKELQ